MFTRLCLQALTKSKQMYVSAKPLSMIIYYLRMIILFIMGFMISPAEAQAVSCTSTSPQCCWVRRIYELMGKTTSVSTTSATACCYYRGTTLQSTGIAGVNCTSTGSVTVIDWKSQVLKNSIPPEIGKLVNLQFLRLNFNQLTGSIPSEIGNLRNLQMLGLNNNQLTGSIPSSIGNLVNLQTLDLKKNQLNGSIPDSIGNLVNLKYIYLGSNQLTGSIPSEIGQLVNLQLLGLNNNQLTGSIPSSIGNLVNLQTLSLWYNKLTGSIPSTIGNLQKLTVLAVYGNPSLNGTITPLCSIKVCAGNTNVTICGCSSKGSPAFLLPPENTPEQCLATGPSSPLQKRTEIFSQNIGSYQFTCNVDGNKNPFQDCLNTQARICNTTYMGNNVTRLSDCKKGVNTMAQGMSYWWKAVRRECGQWSWDGFIGNKDSSNCTSANNNLTQNAYYVTTIGNVYVTSALTKSVNDGLWNNTNLKG